MMRSLSKLPPKERTIPKVALVAMVTGLGLPLVFSLMEIIRDRVNDTVPVKEESGEVRSIDQ